MKNLIHSPGPWKQVINEDGEIWLCPHGDSPGTGHSIYLGDMENTCGECHANFDLMTAAPTMFKVCEALLSMGEMFNYMLVQEAYELADRAMQEILGTRYKPELKTDN